MTCEFPHGPPPEVLEAIEAAWERSRALFDHGFSLHFGIDPVTGRVFAEGRSVGRAILRLSALEALALACGESVEELLHAGAQARLDP